MSASQFFSFLLVHLLHPCMWSLLCSIGLAWAYGFHVTHSSASQTDGGLQTFILNPKPSTYHTPFPGAFSHPSGAVFIAALTLLRKKSTRQKLATNLYFIWISSLLCFGKDINIEHFLLLQQTHLHSLGLDKFLVIIASRCKPTRRDLVSCLHLTLPTYISQANLNNKRFPFRGFSFLSSLVATKKYSTQSVKSATCFLPLFLYSRHNYQLIGLSRACVY